jgi:hypothetical protein
MFPRAAAWVRGHRSGGCLGRSRECAQSFQNFPGLFLGEPVSRFLRRLDGDVFGDLQEHLLGHPQEEARGPPYAENGKDARRLGRRHTSLQAVNNTTWTLLDDQMDEILKTYAIDHHTPSPPAEQEQQLNVLLSDLQNHHS